MEYLFLYTAKVLTEKTVLLPRCTTYLCRILRTVEALTFQHGGQNRNIKKLRVYKYTRSHLRLRVPRLPIGIDK